MTQADVTGSGRNQVDIWHVRLASGETRALSLDELDAGFHDGWITGRTMVLAAGSLRWAPLGEVAGLDETPPAVASTPNSIAPLAIDSFAHAPGSGSDVPFDIDVALDGDGDSDGDASAFRPRRGRRVLTLMTALVVIGGLGFAGFLGRPAVQRALASRGHTASAAAEAKVTPPAPEPPPAVAAGAPAPVPAEAVPTLGAASLPDAAPLTEAERKAAALAEKKAAAEAKKAKRAAHRRGK